MKNKRVLVTGSGTGLGREIALEFGRRGANVVLHYSQSADGANSAVEEIIAGGCKAKAFKANLAQADEAVVLAKNAMDYLGGIDVLVNNAGISMTREFEKTTPEQFDLLYGVNVRAQYFLMQTVVPSMAAQKKGAIVNLSSIHGFRAYKGHSVYAGTKGAIIAMTRELAVELGPRGIRVNAVAPGAVPVENHFLAAGTTDIEAALEATGKVLPCGFAGRPRDIAHVVAFLASDESRYIVGQTILVDGGTSCWMSFSDGFHDMGTPLGGRYVPGMD